MFRMVYQPIWDLKEKVIIGFEALLRPTDAESPIEMLSLYRAQGRSTELDLAIVKHTLEQTQALLKAGQLIFVNVEPETLLEHDIWYPWRFPIEPDRVVLELTERGVTERIDAEFVHALGVQIALDDFGTGLSNLCGLQELSPDFVKMEQQFGAGNNPDSILALMAKYLSERPTTKLIGECVEREEDVLFLKDINIRYGQGFYLGRPELIDFYVEDAEERERNNNAIAGRY